MLGGASMIIDSHAHYNNNAYKKPFRYLSYDKDECALQLMANGVGVGSKVSIQNIMEDGIPVIDISGMNAPEQDDVIDDDDSVVEF